MDVASLLNPQTEALYQPILGCSTNSPETSTPKTSTPKTSTPETSTPEPSTPTLSTPPPAKVFPIFNTGAPRGKKRKADEPITQSGVVGMSHSARAARKRNKKVADGTFVTNDTLLLRFKRKVRLVDPSAGFMVDGNVKKVTHSLCGRSVMMKEPYNTGHFLRHLDTCKGPLKTVIPPGGGITRFLVRKEKTSAPPQLLPCPGLNGVQHECIPTYLRRSSAPGGGATSRTIISRELYDGCKYKKLTKAQKANVRRLQVLQFRWINDHHEGRIVSAKCLGMVPTSEGADEADPCPECTALLRLAALRNALRRPIPDDKNLKYTPKECLGTCLSKLYAGHLGLREIMESPVRAFPPPQRHSVSNSPQNRMTRASFTRRVYSQGNTRTPCSLE